MFFMVNNSLYYYIDFYNWLDSILGAEKQLIKTSTLRYLEGVITEIEDLLLGFKLKITDANIIKKLEYIDNLNNTNNFKVFLDGFKEEYKILFGRQSNNYSYYTRLFSWFKLTVDYLNEVLINLSSFGVTYNVVSY